MPNVQIPQQGLTPTQIVACAIYCCDNQPYTVKKNRPKSVTCQRLAHRKHSCVLHSLREKDGDKLTTENKFSNVWASPRSPRKLGGKVRIPDTVVGSRIIDAKFPCDPDKVYPHLSSNPNVYPSLAGSGESMMTDKEKNIYTKFRHPATGNQVTDVSCMTPEDAKDIIKGTSCKCK